MAMNQLQTNGYKQLKTILNNDTMKQSFRNVLEENAGAFMASILELYQSDTALQECDPNKIILEALKASTLKLPINKQLGFAYIIPYKGVPQFQLGYKGYIQLAQRSGQYRYINADVVYEGEQVTYDRITGMLMITGEATSDTPIGYFAYFQLLNGFEKCVYWSKEKVEAHARRYSRSWNRQNSPWRTNFDAMALKTVIRNIISKYGVMSVEFANAVAEDMSVEERIEGEIVENANKTPLTIPEEVKPDGKEVAPPEVESPDAPQSIEPDEDFDPGF